MNKKFEKLGFYPADILLPKDQDMRKWAVVACDQFTSEPEYWQAVEQTVGDAPSTLRLILPEANLKAPNVDEYIADINASMDKYLADGVFQVLPESLVYIERQQSDGRIRHGLIGMVDLDAYDFTPGSGALIRATEGTVLDRIPPRARVRRNAPIELPHVMLLIDDPEKTVIEPLTAASGEMDKLYDFDLMQNGGHIRGYKLTDRNQWYNGKVGCIMTNGEGHMEWVVANFEDANGADKVIVGPPLLGTGNTSSLTGKTLGVEGERGYSDWGGDYGGYAITKGTKDVYKTLDLLEYLISPEGSKLRLYGIEGTHYTYDEEGNIVADLDGRNSERSNYFGKVKDLDGNSVNAGLHGMGSRFGYAVDWDEFEKSGKIEIATDIGSLYPKYGALVRQALGNVAMNITKNGSTETAADIHHMLPRRR